MSQAELPMQAYDGAVLPRRRPHPLGAMFGVVYLTLAIVVLADPQPVLDWLDDRDPSLLVSVARSCMDRVSATSDALGLSPLSRTLRGWTVPILKRAEASPS